MLFKLLPSLRWLRHYTWVISGVLMASTCVGVSAEKLFDIPESYANESLRQVGLQGEVQIGFSDSDVEGVRTPALHGLYSPELALSILLDGTPLTVVKASDKGTFVVLREDREIEDTIKTQTPEIKETEMNTKTNNWVKTLTAILTLGVGAGQTQSVAQNAEGDSDIYELNPFSVNAEEDSGYVANNTLAGSRLNTALRDTAASINVLTIEFLEDIGATTMEDAILYTTNSDNDLNAGSGGDNAWAEFPANRINMRGLPASRTRNFFPVRNSLDLYNLSRIEEQRGPNSILFGVGSPAGIINANTKRALIGDTFYRGSTLFSSTGGYRATIDANIGLNEALAIRVNAVYSDLDDEMAYHAYRQFQAVDLAVTWKLSDKILFRGEVEWGDENSVQAKSRSDDDEVSLWLESPDSRFTFADWQNPGVTLGDFGISSLGGNDRAVYVDNNNTVVNFKNLHTTEGNGDPLFEENHPELWDPRINDGGPGTLRENSYFTVGGAMEFQISPQTYLELSYNHTKIDTFGYLFSDSGLRGSPNEFLGDNTTPNIGAGKLYLEGQWRRWTKVNDYTSYRATLSHEMDFDKWGNYRVALLYELDDEFDSNQHRREAWVDANGQGLFHSDPRNARNRTYRRHYIFEEGNWKNYYVSGPGVDGLIDGIQVDTGQTAYSAWRNQNSGRYADADYTTALVGLQARYFEDRLVLGMGYRNDKLTVRQFDTRDENNQFFRNEFGERITSFDSWDETDYNGDTKTLGGVFHINDNLRVLFNHSDNFGLPSNSRRSYPNNGPADNTEGIGYDYGIGFSFLDNAVSGRLTRFETDSKNIYLSGFNLTNINSALWDAAVFNEEITGVTQAQADANFFSGTGGTSDQHVEGYEFSMTANLTSNWRMLFNYSYTDGFQTNTFPDQVEYRDGDVNGRLGGFGGLTFFENPAWAALPLAEEGADTIGEFIQDFKDDLAEDLAVDGVALAKNRPYKANVFTRYSFEEGKLKGAFVGGGVKYQDATDLGVGFDANGSPFAMQGTSFTTADFLLGYTFKELFGLERVSFQLNVTNLFDFSDYIITGRNASTGEITKVVYLRPQVFSLTTRFSF